MDKKAMRLAFIRQRFQQLDIQSFAGIIPASQRDIAEEMKLNDGFREFQKDRATSREALTSDEG